jgi:hypothetical protein
LSNNQLRISYIPYIVLTTGNHQRSWTQISEIIKLIFCRERLKIKKNISNWVWLNTENRVWTSISNVRKGLSQEITFEKRAVMSLWSCASICWRSILSKMKNKYKEPKTRMCPSD